MATNKQLEKQLQEITNRLKLLEQSLVQSNPTQHTHKSIGAEKTACRVPIVKPRPLEPGIGVMRENIIRSVEKKWINGTLLRYCFVTDFGPGYDGDQDAVRRAFQEWKDIGMGLSFKEVQNRNKADIRIGFERGAGSWSYVGRDIWEIPFSKRTMNFGWPLVGDDGYDTALHEIGHTLGFHHEQFNPFAGIVWDEEAVYRYFAGPPNYWSREDTYHNVLRTLDPRDVEGSKWDPNSIMQYAFGPNLILRPEEYRNGLDPEPGLSEIDKQRVRLFYPELNSDLEILKPFEPQKLSILPAEQANFLICPESTRKYKIQTFGDLDSLMVLFEEVDGVLEHFMADDDSGWNRNAAFEPRLVQGRKYVLRVRTYSGQTSPNAAVMIW